MDMEGKVVLITGAASGIGQAASVLFAQNGAKLFLTDKESLEKTVKMCEEKGLKKDKINCCIGDLLIQEDIDRIVETALKQYKKVDVLVNNAGVNRNSKVHTSTMDELDTMYKLIFRAPYYLCQKLLPALIETKGCIINVTSGAATMACADCTNYSCMKAALQHLTRIIALDFGPKGVRVNSVAPSATKTNIFYAGGTCKTEQDREQVLRASGVTYPLRRYAEAIEVAEGIYFLASEKASFITGVELPVDGGYLISGGRT